MKKIVAKTIHGAGYSTAEVIEQSGEFYECNGYQFIIYWGNGGETCLGVELGTGLSLWASHKYATRAPKREVIEMIQERSAQTEKMRIAIEKAKRILEEHGFEYPLNPPITGIKQINK